MPIPESKRRNNDIYNAKCDRISARPVKPVGNAIRAAARLGFLRPEDGKSPYQLQPFVKRAEKDVSR